LRRPEAAIRLGISPPLVWSVVELERLACYQQAGRSSFARPIPASQWLGARQSYVVGLQFDVADSKIQPPREPHQPANRKAGKPESRRTGKPAEAGPSKPLFCSESPADSVTSEGCVTSVRYQITEQKTPFGVRSLREPAPNRRRQADTMETNQLRNYITHVQALRLPFNMRKRSREMRGPSGVRSVRWGGPPPSGPRNRRTGTRVNQHTSRQAER